MAILPSLAVIEHRFHAPVSPAFERLAG